MTNATDEIGRNIRRRRQMLGLTLDALAERSGVSTTMLSEVERSVKNPTVKLAYQIARALECSLTDLLEQPETPVTLVRAAERRTLLDPESGVERHGLATALLRHGLEVAWYTIPPKASAGEMAPNRPGMLELISVVSGALTVTLGKETHELQAGDTLTYGPQTTMEYRNDGRGSCTFLLLSDSSAAS